MSINLRTNEIKDIFSLFDDPLDKYTEIIEFGRKNDSFNDKYKSDSYKIPGCASLAWVYVKKNNSKYRIHTNSEAHIVKGLLYILEYIMYNTTIHHIYILNVISLYIHIYKCTHIHIYTYTQKHR